MSGGSAGKGLPWCHPEEFLIEMVHWVILAAVDPGALIRTGRSQRGIPRPYRIGA